MKRTQILSYGGGVQTVAMIAAVLTGKLPCPDLIVIADTGREKTSTWDYLDEVIQPALSAVDLRVEVAGHELATVDLYAHNGDLLLPAYTGTGKMPTFCSNEWKQRVIRRWARAQGVEKCDVWIGFTTDEENRVGKDQHEWFRRTYPLIELGMNRADCLALIAEAGWPTPFKSSCWMCPNMNDAEWTEMKENYPDDFAKAAKLEKEIIEWDGVYLHSSCQPIELVDFDPSRAQLKSGHYQCSMGFCWV